MELLLLYAKQLLFMQIQQRKTENRTECFDIIRRKWVPMTPEETVRQFLIHFMIEEKKVPAIRISVEREITVNGLKRRYDLVVYAPSGTPQAVIECKAPHVQLTQAVVEQVGRYNKTLRAPFIGVSNGKQSLFFKIDFDSEKISFLEGWPF